MGSTAGAGADAERERSQLVIALGEGEKGERLKRAVERVARAHGKKPSAWVRERVLVAIAEHEAETGESLFTSEPRTI